MAKKTRYQRYLLAAAGLREKQNRKAMVSSQKSILGKLKTLKSGEVRA